MCSSSLTGSKAKFYVDTGSEITVIKQNAISPDTRVDKGCILKIHGVTAGECYTLGRIRIMLNNLLCVAHIVSNSFPIDEDAIIGWQTLAEHRGIVNSEEQCVDFPEFSIPFMKNETFIIPPRSRKVIYARVQNSDTKMGFVPLMDLGPEILFGNFVAQNRNGKAYALCINISENPVEIIPPAIELQDCETISDDNRLLTEAVLDTTDGVAMLKLFSNTYDDEKNDRATRVLNLMDLSDLNNEEKEHVRNLVKEMPHLYGLPGEKLKATSLLTHKIITTTDVPIRAKQYRHPPTIKEEMQRQIRELLDAGVIKPSSSPYTSPLWVVPKKPDKDGNKRWRLVTDFRQLNEITVPDSFPLPLTTDIIDNVSSAAYITAIDLKSGFYQIPMDPSSAHKTAFAGPYGIYEFNRLAMGLRNGPATFQRLMSLVLAGLQGYELYVYLDDVIIFAKDLEEHGKKFRRLMKRLDNANLTIEPTKCQFLRKEPNFLGHIAGNGNIRPDPKKIEAMSNYPIPSNVKKVKQFLGLVGYYRRFIKNFAKIAMPLSKLLRNHGRDFKWEKEQHEAFETLRKKLCEQPILKAPDMSKPFIVTTDASDYALGAILSQGEVGNDLPCAYASRCLKGPELRYSTYDRELLAVVFARDQFRPFLYGRKFTLITDHEPLKHFHNTKRPDLRFNRMKAQLIGYEFDVIYRPGNRNVNADAFSRNPVIHEGEENPELPRVKLYELADKAEKISISDDDDDVRLNILRTRKRPRLHKGTDRKRREGRLTSNSESSGNPRARKIPNIYKSNSDSSDVNSSTESDKGYIDNYLNFQATSTPLISEKTAQDNKDAESSEEDQDAVFEKGEFIAVRNNLDNFYICQATKNIFKHDKHIRIRWLTATKEDPMVYAFDYYDYIDFKCILTNVRMSKIKRNIYQLTVKEIQRVQKLLKESINADKKSQIQQNINIQSSLRQELNAETAKINENNSKRQENANAEKFSKQSTYNGRNGDSFLNKSKDALFDKNFEVQFYVNLRGQEKEGKQGLQINIWESDNKCRNDNNNTNLDTDIVFLGGSSDFLNSINSNNLINFNQLSNSNNLENLNISNKSNNLNHNLNNLNNSNNPNHLNNSICLNSSTNNLNNAVDSDNLTQVDQLDLAPRKDFYCIAPLDITRASEQDKEQESHLLPPNNVHSLNHMNVSLPHSESNRSIRNDAHHKPGTMNTTDEQFIVYTEMHECKEPDAHLVHFSNIPTDPPGNCLFYSLMKILGINESTRAFRDKLLSSPALTSCGNPAEAIEILSSNNKYGNDDCIYIFSQTYNVNVCVHYHIQNGNIIYAHFNVADNVRCLHLHLKDTHYTPFIVEQQHMIETDNNESEEEQLENVNSEKHRSLPRYIVAGARSPKNKPPWLPHDTAEIPAFSHVKILNEHPFAYQENLVYLLSADICLDSEVLNALAERHYINIDEINSDDRQVGEIILTEHKTFKLFGIVIKKNVDDKASRFDITKSIKTLKHLIMKNNINSIGIIRDLDMISLQNWNFFIEQVNIIFRQKPLSIVFLLNNLPIPKVEERYRLIKEYHESSIAGHKGISKTYDKLARNYYWKHMRADVRQFVKGCLNCQTRKLVRVKTKLPMLITDTSSRPFQKISMDFYGPLEVTKAGNRYILTIQDTLTKYCILVPLKRATAKEVARAMVNRFICYFGPPSAILTDQGTNFLSRTLEEFARMFRIEKYNTSAYHPQSNGGVERMHHTLTEYMKGYTDGCHDEWDKWVYLAQHSYNTAIHESTGYTPHELVFGTRALTPSNFPSKDYLLTFDEYLANLAENLAQLQTVAAMNLIQSKYRSKYYYDKKLNTKHFREGESVFLINEKKNKKFDDEYEGRYEIIKIDYNTHNVTIQRNGEIKVVHIDKIKRFSEAVIRDQSSVDNNNT